MTRGPVGDGAPPIVKDAPSARWAAPRDATAPVDDDTPFLVREWAPPPPPPAPVPDDHVFVLDTGERRDREVTESVTVRAAGDAEAAGDDAPAAPDGTARQGASGWAVGAVLTGVALVVLLSLTRWVASLAATGTLSGALGALAAGLIVLGLGALALREWRDLSRLRGLGACRAGLGVARLPEGRAETRRHLEAAARRLAAVGPFADGIAEWTRTRLDQGTPRDMLGAFEAVVLRRADEQAVTAIRRGSRDAMAMVMLSPNTALDTAAFLVVGLRMTRRICESYGLRPTGLGAVRILRRALTGAALVGIVESTVEVGAQMVGEAALGKIAGAVAGGATAGLKMARLGLCVMETVRPLDHVGTTPPTLLSCYRPIQTGRR